MVDIKSNAKAAGVTAGAAPGRSKQARLEAEALRIFAATGSYPLLAPGNRLSYFSYNSMIPTRIGKHHRTMVSLLSDFNESKIGG